VDSVTAFRESLKRCLEKPNFLLDFYGTFMASSEEIREKFRHTDQKRQTEVLADTLWKMAVLVQGQPGSPARVDLARLAELHSRRHLDIRPGLYDQWLECLVVTARHHDPLFTPEIEQAWRETLAVGIEFLRSGY
jgi:hemoglobin-like flavoprotein